MTLTRAGEYITTDFNEDQNIENARKLMWSNELTLLGKGTSVQTGHRLRVTIQINGRTPKDHPGGKGGIGQGLSWHLG
jgi:hypothetical protein